MKENIEIQNADMPLWFILQMEFGEFERMHFQNLRGHMLFLHQSKVFVLPELNFNFGVDIFF